MARIASTVLVVALLAATAAAFALTQGLKLQKSPIFGTRVQPVFSPVCECDRETARIAFKLRKSSRLDVSIVDGGEVVRTIVRGRRYPEGPVELEWDGRDDAGRVMPEGEYLPRVHVRSEPSDDHAAESDPDRRDPAGAPGRQRRDRASSRPTETAAPTASRCATGSASRAEACST